LEQYTLIAGGTRKEVNDLIKGHDRIVMCGHGSPWGLFSVGMFDGSYIIDCDTVPLFEDRELVMVWCNADKFVNRYNLKGLYSGMFVSETGEVGKGMHRDLYHAYHRMMNDYEQLAEHNIVAQYNSDRLYMTL